MLEFKRLSALILTPIALLACSAQPFAGIGRQAPSCSDLVVESLTTADREVHGAFACMAGTLQAAARRAGVESDLDLLAFAQQSPHYALYRRCPAVDLVERRYLIHTDEEGVPDASITTVSDATGKVVKFTRSATLTSCG